MAYRGIDRNRFTYLVSLGTDDLELMRFFFDCRIKLIQTGGKVQNVPSTHKARIRTLATELPPAADEVVQNWFSKNLAMVDAETVQEVMEEFKLYEELGEGPPEDDARRLARSCLVHLFSNDTNQSLLDFLKTPVGGKGDAPEEVIEPLDEQSHELPVVSYPQTLPHVLMDLIERRDPDQHLEGLAPSLAMFVVGLQAGVQGQMKHARDALDALVAERSLFNLLEQFLKQQEAKSASDKTHRRGLRFTELASFEGQFDIEQDEVLAYCTSADQPTAVFLHPIVILRGGDLQLLTNEMRQKCFPKTGDVMAFARVTHPRQPRRGEFGVWRIAEHPTEKATRFHIAAETRLVYQVRQVPFSSTQYDSVREFLKEDARLSTGSALQPQLFQLDDGLVVGGRSDRPDFSKDETFESSLRSWNALPALRLEGRIFVLGPLPAEDVPYECASFATVIRKLFRSYGGGRKTSGALTRAQLRELALSLNSEDASVDLSLVRNYSPLYSFIA